jgi:membrane protease YdiL (CAAX protease family)
LADSSRQIPDGSRPALIVGGTPESPAESGSPDAPSEVVERWKWRYRQRIDEAWADPKLLHRLRSWGSWPIILLDLILLLVVEVFMSLILSIVAVVVIGVHNKDFFSKLTIDTAMQKAVQSTSDWALSPAGLAIGAALTQVGIFLILYWRVVAPRIMTWTDLGYGSALRDRPLRAFVIGIGIAIVALVCGDSIVVALHHLGLNTSGQETTLKSVRHSSLIVFLPFAFTAAVSAPIAEETFFRAYLFRALTVRYGFPVGIVGSSIAFGLLHVLGGVTWEALGLVAIGAVLAYGYARTGNLITNVTAHVLNNLIGLIALYNP